MSHLYHYICSMHLSQQRKKWLSIAEISVIVIVIWILFAAIVPIFSRFGAVKRNTQRIADIKQITTQVKAYNLKNARYPKSLRELEVWGVGDIPKDPSNMTYCTGTPWYVPWDYQYYFCADCLAVWPFKDHPMKYIAQIGALMERETSHGERTAGNRWALYGEWETTDCAANAIRWVGAPLEWVKWNRIGWTGAWVTSIQTNVTQRDYSPWYSAIIASEEKSK